MVHKNTKTFLIIGIVVAIVTLLGTTYSFFLYNKTGKNISLTTGEIGINFVNDINYINITDAYPISDTIGKIYPYYTDFTVTGLTNEASIRYEIQIIPDVNNTIKNEYIKVYLTDQDDNDLTGAMGHYEPTMLDLFEDAKENYGKTIYYDYIDGEETENGIINKTTIKKYRLRLWIDQSYTANIKQNFSFKVYLYAYNDDTNSKKLGTHILLTESGSTNITTAKSVIEAKGQVDVNNTAPTYDSEGNINGGDLGLYAQEDDYGMSYFYRGAVTNNNVKFAGFYWKIIRINGDGSIRLIYNGTDSDATGNATGINGKTYTYNPKYPDPTYVGYMYGDNLVSQESLEANYYTITASTSYVFAKNYDIVPGTTNYVLRDDPDDTTDTITKKFSEMNAMMEEGKTDNFFTVYPYTCMKTSSSSQCQLIIKASSYNETSNYATATFISFSSTSLDNTRLNNASSNIKIELETWYQNNILNKNDANGNSYSKYVTDQTFCNNRSMPNASLNSGYLRNIHTYYDGYQRLSINAVKTAKLTCNGDIRDTFSATNTKGNGLLTYPVGLITADEAALAGMRWGSDNNNPNNYLTTGESFWTMTPSVFFTTSAYAFVISVVSTGNLYYRGVNNVLNARAVINLSSNTLITTGNGTSETPYEVTIE